MTKDICITLGMGIEGVDNIKALVQKLALKMLVSEDFVQIIAGRGRDIEDVRAILLKNPNYNVRYIKG